MEDYISNIQLHNDDNDDSETDDQDEEEKDEGGSGRRVRDALESFAGIDLGDLSSDGMCLFAGQDYIYMHMCVCFSLSRANARFRMCTSCAYRENQ